MAVDAEAVRVAADPRSGVRDRVMDGRQMGQVNYPEHDPALPVVAFDFDGVLATNTWPSPRLGYPQRDAILALHHYAAEDCEIVIFTARPDEHLPRIRKWLEDQQISWLVYEVTNRKPKACLYFDDRAVRWPL